MYYWNIKSLKDDIRNNKLSEHDRFLYALIYVVLGSISMEAMMWMGMDSKNIWDGIATIVNIIIATIGTIYAYKANGGSQGIDFLGRYFSIGFVMVIRFIVLLIPMFFALFIYYYFVFGEQEIIPSTAFDVIPFLIWYAALYWRICKHISDVKN